MKVAYWRKGEQSISVRIWIKDTRVYTHMDVYFYIIAAFSKRWLLIFLKEHILISSLSLSAPLSPIPKLCEDTNCHNFPCHVALRCFSSIRESHKCFLRNAKNYNWLGKKLLWLLKQWPVHFEVWLPVWDNNTRTAYHSVKIIAHKWYFLIWHANCSICLNGVFLEIDGSFNQFWLIKKKRSRGGILMLLHVIQTEVVKISGRTFQRDSDFFIRYLLCELENTYLDCQALNKKWKADWRVVNGI